MIIEMRGNRCCTVFPASRHESGEFVEFDSQDDYVPANSTWEELKRASIKIAIATVPTEHGHRIPMIDMT
jgi:hypothetical protein